MVGAATPSLAALAYHRGVTDSPSAIRPSGAARLTDEVRAFLDDTRVATIATLDPDGTPRQAVVWYRLDGDEIVLNSAVGRRWPTNLVRDPRVALTAMDRDGYRWVGITGRVTPVEDQPTAQADIAEMARRYHRDEPDEAETMIAERFQKQVRISFRLRPTTIVNYVD